jgi:hypothetical protein
MDISDSVNPEYLLTAAAFVSYLLYQNKRLIEKIDRLESERQEIYERYIDRVSQSNSDLMEATRLFDRLTQASK